VKRTASTLIIAQTQFLATDNAQVACGNVIIAAMRNQTRGSWIREIWTFAVTLNVCATRLFPKRADIWPRAFYWRILISLGIKNPESAAEFAAAAAATADQLLFAVA